MRGHRAGGAIRRRRRCSASSGNLLSNAVDPRYHDKVFEIFHRLQDVEVEGTGVGLAIVKKTVDAAGGRVRVESEVGRRATFRFTWPAVRDVAPTGPRSGALPPGTPGADGT